MDLIIVFLIITIPFMFYLYLLVPETEDVNTIFGSFSFDFYHNAESFTWHLFSKLLLILLLSIWFSTSDKFWRYIILIPISMELFKLISILNDEFELFMRESWFISFFKVLPYTLFLVTIIAFVLNWIGYLRTEKNINSELIDAIENLMLRSKDLNKIDFNNQILSDFERVKKDYQNDKKKYLSELIKLRNKLVSYD